MWCVISPSSWCPSCTVTAGWAPGMGGLISHLSIRSLLAVLEMGGNTIPLQFDFKPHRSIYWAPYSGSSFYHSFFPILLPFAFSWLSIILCLCLSVSFSFAFSNLLSLSLFFSFFCSVNVIYSFHSSLSRLVWIKICSSHMFRQGMSLCHNFFPVSSWKQESANGWTVMHSYCMFSFYL